jgi:pimeloyl-ACP methyl ester carboxylesterase
MERAARGAVTPEWFTKALLADRRERTIDVEGAHIHFVEWGEVGDPGLVFVHGGAAHAEWWAHLAPLFTSHYHVTVVGASATHTICGPEKSLRSPRRPGFPDRRSSSGTRSGVLSPSRPQRPMATTWRAR